MENKFTPARLPLSLIFAFFVGGCSLLYSVDEEPGLMEICIEDALPGTKTGFPSADEFILTVQDSEGGEIYHGLFGDSPEVFSVAPGNYTVSAVSREFTEPLFEAPQFGDTQVVAVVSGKTVSAKLGCSQMNCGVLVSLDYSFRKAFPDGVLYLKGAGGKLMYGYAETRTAYLQSGGVTLSLYNDGQEQTLCSRSLQPAEMLRISLTSDATVSSGSSAGVSLQVDTSRIWTSENLCIGGESGDEPSDALSVTQARSSIGQKGVWVQGYIVGVATSTGKFSFTAPFTRNTNLVLGLRSTSTDKEYLLTVELSKGDARDALNLVDNPELLGTRALIKGDVVESYYGIPGLKNVSDFRLK